jgi:hypothetical protein
VILVPTIDHPAEPSLPICFADENDLVSTRLILLLQKPATTKRRDAEVVKKLAVT